MFKGALQIAFIFTKLLSQLQDLSQLQVTTPTYIMNEKSLTPPDYCLLLYISSSKLI